MVTFSRMRSIFFMEASLRTFFGAEDAISLRELGQSSCRRRAEQKPQNQKDLWQRGEGRPHCERPLSG